MIKHFRIGILKIGMLVALLGFVASCQTTPSPKGTLRTSAFGGKADIIKGVGKSPLIARSGHVVGNELILPTHLEIRQPTSPIA